MGAVRPMTISVRFLSGETVEVARDGMKTVKDLKTYIQQEHHTKCKLYVHGRKLADHEELATLEGFITALAKLVRAGPTPSAQTASPGITAEEHVANAGIEPSEPPSRPPLALDAQGPPQCPAPSEGPPPAQRLPPIYRDEEQVTDASSEPPARRRRAPRKAMAGGPAGDCDGPRQQQEEDEQGTAGGSAPAKQRGPGARQGGMPEPRDLLEMVGRPLVGRAAKCADRLPLSPELEGILGVFEALNTVFGFLSRHHVQATLHNVRCAVADLRGGTSITMADVEAMAGLAPHVVCLIPVEDGPQGKGQRTDGAGSVADPGGFLRSRVEGALHGDAYGRLDDWAGGAYDVTVGGDTNVIVELFDPGSRRERNAFTQAGLGSLAGAEVLQVWSDQRKGKGSAEAQQTERGVSNATARRTRAFRHALAVATALALQDGQADAAEPQASSDEDAEAEADLRVATKAQDSPAVSGWVEPFCTGEWPEGCDPASVSLAAAVAAAQRALGRAQATAAAPAQPVSKALRHLQSPVKNARPPSLVKASRPCRDTAALGVDAWLAHLQTLPWYKGQLVYRQERAGREPQHRDPSVPLQESTLRALQSRGVSRLFRHQAEAIDAVTAGRHTVVATSTASGKSLCYNVPVLEALARDPATCALYMFPTKALAQDQLGALRGLVRAAFGGASGDEGLPSVDIYDGDTPMGDRAGIRARAQLLVTNPDMIHMSVLPVHATFERFLRNLRFVVIDEGHAYRGLFGCHMALLVRRLRRVCQRVYQSNPTFVVTSATIANPVEHVGRLLGVEDVVAVVEDGSPHGPKEVVFWNPPLTEQAERARQMGLRVPSHTESRATFKEREAARKARSRSAAGSGQSGGESGGEADGSGLGTRAGAGAGVGVRKGEARARAREMQRIMAREANAARYGARQLAVARGVGEAEWVAAVAVGRKRAAALRGEDGDGVEGGSWVRDVRRQVLASDGAAVLPAGRLTERARGEGVEQEALAAAADVAKGHFPRLADVGLHMRRAGAAAEGRGVRAMAGAEDSTVRADDDLDRLRDGAGGSEGAGALAEGHEVALDVDAKARAELAVAGAALPQPNSRPQRVLHRRRVWGSRVVGRGGSQGSGSADDGMGDAVKQLVYLPQVPAGRGRVEVEQGTAQGTEQDGEGRVARVALGDVPGEVLARKGAAGTLEDERRSSPIVEVALLLAEAVQHGLRTIAFCRTRKLCELVACYTRETLRASAPHLVNAVSVYRGGYAAQDRREIEGALFCGRLRGVAATNALELGVDVGELDCTLHLGFPGSVASLWQQAGRAGRRGQKSLAVYVAFDGPLDQYFMRNPEALLGRPIERTGADPENEGLMAMHVACAAKEVPLHLGEDVAYFGRKLSRVAAGLLKDRVIGRPPTGERGCYAYVGPDANPAASVSLRAIDPDRFTIVDESSQEVLEEIEESKAFFEVYDGAIYMYQGRTYLCKRLDVGARVAVVRPVQVKYYTAPIDVVDVHVIGARNAYSALGSHERGQAGRPSVDDARPSHPGAASLTGPDAGPSRAGCPTAVCADAVVTTQWIGFHRIWRGSGRIFDTVELYLPASQVRTEAAFVAVPHALRAEMRGLGLPLREGLHAAAHAVLNVLPLHVVCNAGDVKAECDNPYATRYRPERLLLYDSQPGGVGLAAQAAPLFPLLLSKALALVEGCGCAGGHGCPGCIQSTDCSQYNAVLEKRAGLHVLRRLVELCGVEGGRVGSCKEEGAEAGGA